MLRVYQLPAVLLRLPEVLCAHCSCLEQAPALSRGANDSNRPTCAQIRSQRFKHMLHSTTTNI